MRNLTGWMNFIICALLFLSITAASQESDTSQTAKELFIANNGSNYPSDSLSKEDIDEINTKNGFSNLFIQTGGVASANKLHPKAAPFVKGYLEENGNRLQKMKGWGDPHFKLIEKILTKYNLPKELKYLAVIESDLKSNAVSWAGAVGPWQLMPETAKILGLKINRYRDDRKDLSKSTHAAAKYLRDLYSQLDDWLLVIAAYNGGPARVEAAIKRSKSRNFWNLQYKLPAESRNHVKKFIATHYIMEGQGGITTSVAADLNHASQSLLSNEDFANTQAISLRGKYNSGVIVKSLSMDIAEFNRLNPAFDHHVSTNEYRLRLPNEKMDLFNQNKDQILNESVQYMLTNTATEKQSFPAEIALPEKKQSFRSKGSK
jgi:membrane-bound lytic murein transglycosylase D